MRKRDDALRETLLTHAREAADAGGTDAINIRALAKQAGVSTGTVYNYFANKDDILLALTEAYWQETLAGMWQALRADSFVGQVEEMYRFLRAQVNESAGTLMSSLRSVEAMGRDKMQAMQQSLGQALIPRMDADSRIPSSLWNETFSKASYAAFIVMNLMLLLRMNAPNINFFLEIMEKTLYQRSIKK